MSDFKEKVEAMGEEIKESFKEGAEAMLDDFANDKHLMDEIFDNKHAKKDAKKEARKANFESTVAELKDSFEKGAEEFKADSAAVAEGIAEIAGAAGVEVKVEGPAAEAFESAKSSFEDGVESLKSDAAFTKEAFDNAAAEIKEQKAAKEEAKREKFDKAIEELKEGISEQ